jgi:ABC-type multidrug transport system permease subunit
LKEKEEGIGKRKRNQGIVISIFFLLLIALVITAILIYVPVLGLIF